MARFDARVTFVRPIPRNAAFRTMESAWKKRNPIMIRKKETDISSVSGCLLQSIITGLARNQSSMPSTRESIMVIFRME